jgi:hypothetical protein
MSATYRLGSTPSAGGVATALDARAFSVNAPAADLFHRLLVSLTDDQGVIRLVQVESHQLGPDGQM